jgi:hypothetical protein
LRPTSARCPSSSTRAWKVASSRSTTRPRPAAVLIDLVEYEPVRLKAARAARDRFCRDYDATFVGPRPTSFLLGGI